MQTTTIVSWNQPQIGPVIQKLQSSTASVHTSTHSDIIKLFAATRRVDYFPVIVTASDLDDNPNYCAHNATILATQVCFSTVNQPNQWLCYDFQGVQVTPFQYVIRSGPFIAGSAHPRHWVVEGSVSGTIWTELDHRDDENTLNGANLTVRFGIPTQHRHQFRLIRIRQTGLNHCGNNSMTIAYFGITRMTECADLRIVKHVCQNLQIFPEKTFRLLYRATDDGFGAADFHRLCDGCTNTLTVIRINTGDIIGGYTPCEWKSACQLINDPTRQTFVFTMSRGENGKLRKFALKSNMGSTAIFCSSEFGPTFGTAYDLHICDRANVQQGSYCKHIGQNTFTVREIEVFEVDE
jgi:hypothetical protein